MTEEEYQAGRGLTVWLEGEGFLQIFQLQILAAIKAGITLGRGTIERVPGARFG